jgi:hypothetical protein
MAALSPHYGSKTSSSLPSPPLSPRTHNAALASYSPECVEYVSVLKNSSMLLWSPDQELKDPSLQCFDLGLAVLDSFLICRPAR